MTNCTRIDVLTDPTICAHRAPQYVNKLLAAFPALEAEVLKMTRTKEAAMSARLRNYRDRCLDVVEKRQYQRERKEMLAEREKATWMSTSRAARSTSWWC